MKGPAIPRKQFLLLLSLMMGNLTSSFVVPNRRHVSSKSTRLRATITPEEIKLQLQEYLNRRRELRADELAEQEKGKIIGGTKGNKVLDYISGAPVKERVIDRVPNVFDYDELTKYGCSNLVTPIMELGGRRAAYELMDMQAPALQGPPPKKKAPKLIIDRTGKEDKARYSGLKMGQVLDDNVMAEALVKANEKAKAGKNLRQKLMEEEYERPFADKRNTGPRQTPEWTVETLDEYTKQQGNAISWAKRARQGEFVKDPSEILDLTLPMALYCVMTWMLVAFAFGRSTPAFLTMAGMTDTGIEHVFQLPGLALALASLGSGVVSSTVLAPQLNRDSFVWGIKGVCGGPLAVLELRGLEPLITRGELEGIRTKPGP